MSEPAVPNSVCILRLSAIGDCCHVVPVVRAIQERSPDTRITWVIGGLEARLLGDIPGVEFVVYDKRTGLAGARELRRRFRDHPFDALLHTQRSFRANLLARFLPAIRRIGYDRGRWKELHGWVIDESIPAGPPQQHAMDCMLSFLEPLGIPLPARPRWDIPVSATDRAFAAEHVPADGRSIILSPASSIPSRNWRPERYAALADHAVANHGFRVLLCGGPSPTERALGDAILSYMEQPATDLIGKDTLKQMLAMLERAALLISPDTGPAHMATAVGTPVLGLHGATDFRRSGPYYSRPLCVSCLDRVAPTFLGVEADDLPWGRHVQREGVMDLLELEPVLERFDAWVRGEVRPLEPPVASA